MKAFKYKLRPSPRVARLFELWLDLCRELHNAALEERIKAYRMNGVSLSYAVQCAELPEVKAGRPDVGRVNAQVLQQVLKRLNRSFENFFRRVKNGDRPGFPRFKSKRRYDSFTFPQAKGGFRLEGKKLHLSKIGSVRVFLSRPLEGTPKTCTIKREADGWYAVITCDAPKAEPLPETGQAVGIDLGIETFARLHDGTPIENPKFLRRAERRLKTAHRRVSRRKRGSKRRTQAVVLLAKHHQRIARQRRDFHFKTAKDLVSRFDRIAVEDLNVTGMVKNHHLAKAIHDAAWNTFLEILHGGAEEAGRVMVRVDARFTSSDCSNCGNRVRKSLSEREHRCIACGLVVHRDINAARNILARGHRVRGGDALAASMNRVPA